MFSRLGSFAVRFRWFIIAAWFLVAIVLTVVAPNINDVAVSDQRAFLPASAPSLDANEVVKKYFPDRVSPSSAVVVVDAGAGNRADQGAAAEFVNGLTAWLTGPDKPAGVDRVLSPALGDEQTKTGLTSPDKQVALVLTRFAAVGTEEQTKVAIAAIHDAAERGAPGRQGLSDRRRPHPLRLQQRVAEEPRLDHLDHDPARGGDPAHHLSISGESHHPARDHRAGLRHLSGGHRVPRLRPSHHIDVHQRLPDRGPVRRGHRLLPVPHQPLQGGDVRGRHRGTCRQDDRADHR